MTRRRRASMVVAVGFALVVALAVPYVSTSEVAHPHVVSEDPANTTPRLVPFGGVDRPYANGIGQLGDTMYAGGRFLRVFDDRNDINVDVENFVIFDAGTYAVNTDIPAFDGEVWAVEPYADDNAVFVGGSAGQKLMAPNPQTGDNTDYIDLGIADEIVLDNDTTAFGDVSRDESRPHQAGRGRELPHRRRPVPLPRLHGRPAAIPGPGRPGDAVGLVLPAVRGVLPEPGAAHRGCCDHPGPNAVERLGIGAIGPTTGQALSWAPAKPAKQGGKQLLATQDGLWVVSDSKRFRGEPRYGIAFAPLP